jgi:glycosyltransferase involved in cell wall biosynthesis
MLSETMTQTGAEPAGRTLLVVLPALDEARNLPEVLADLRERWPDAAVLVVDDASTDDTATVARTHGALVATLPFRLGYGGAVQAGIKYGLRRRFPVVVTFDADGQHDPADIEPLLEAVAEGADLAIGSRALAAGSYRGGVARRWGRILFAGLARVLTGLRLTDPTSGLKALGPRGQALFALSRFPDRYPDADALVLARRARLSITERPAHMRPSRNRRSMHGGLHSLAYGFNMLFSLFVAATGRDLHRKE